MKTVSTMIAVLCILGSTSVTAAPFGVNIPLPVNTAAQWNSTNKQYKIKYHSDLLGDWVLYGRRQHNSDGSYTDTIDGTVSSANVTTVLTKSNTLGWASDSLPPWHTCDDFRIEVTNGRVKGWATFHLP